MYLTWNPIAESKPPLDEMHLLVWLDTGTYISVDYCMGQFVNWDGDEVTPHVTHWAEVTGPEHNKK